MSIGEYRYAECNTQCNNISNWTVTSTGSAFYADNSRYFALDNLNRPRLVYDDQMSTYGSGHLGTWYRFCDSNCTNSVNWFETMLTTDHLIRPSLVFSSTGQPRFLADYVGDSTRELRYYACNMNCSNSANWSYIALIPSVAETTYSLRLDHSDRPRLVLFTGNRRLPDDNKLEYFWCDTSCMATTDNWNGYDLGLDEYYGKDPDLVFDNQNRPNLAFFVDASPYGLGYSNCTANCESLSAAWNSQFIETTDELNASNPVDVSTSLHDFILVSRTKTIPGTRWYRPAIFFV